jgi:hypothetical protein
LADLDLDAWVGGAELRENGRYVDYAEALFEADCEVAAEQALHCGDRVFGGFGGGEGTAAFAKEGASCLGELDAAGVADEEGCPEFTLERADRR